MINLRANPVHFLRFGWTRRAPAARQNADAERDRRWAAWIDQMAKGGIEALSSFYDESSPVIFSLVHEILNDRSAAEDTLIEIYDQARREAATFSSRRQAPLDWLVTLARNVAAGRKRRTRPAPSSGPAQDQFKHKRRIANLALARLSDEQRSILEMTYLGGLTAAETADVLELSVDYVKEQIGLAMQTLRSGSRRR